MRGAGRGGCCARQRGTRGAGRASESGLDSIEAYVEALVRADLQADAVDSGAPPHLSVESDDQLEALLLERLQSTEPGIEATPQFWERLHDEARARRLDRVEVPGRVEARVMAAREAGLPVVRLRRPPAEPGLKVKTIAAAMEWLGERLASDLNAPSSQCSSSARSRRKTTSADST